MNEKVSFLVRVISLDGHKASLELFKKKYGKLVYSGRGLLPLGSPISIEELVPSIGREQIAS